MRWSVSCHAAAVALAVALVGQTGCPTTEEEPAPDPPIERDDFPYITDGGSRGCRCPTASTTRRR